MTDFYSDIAVIADELLAEFGATCILSVPGSGTYDAATGTKTNGASTDHDITAVVLNFPQKYIDGTLIKVGDKRVIVSSVGLTVDPEPGHVFIDGGGSSKVISADKRAPAGQSVIWILQVRK